MRNLIGRLLTLTLLLALLSLWGSGCGVHVTRNNPVEVRNDSDKPVVIYNQLYINGKPGVVKDFGRVNPGEKRTVLSMIAPPKSDYDVYHVEARDLDGKLIKSWEFPFQERILLVIDKTDASQ